MYQWKDICLYPVANHLGWDDDRLCENGLLGHEVGGGTRAVHAPLQQQVAEESLRFEVPRDPASSAKMPMPQRLSGRRLAERSRREGKQS